MERKTVFLPGEVLQMNKNRDEVYSNNELQEVSRGHSNTMVATMVEGAEL